MFNKLLSQRVIMGNQLFTNYDDNDNNKRIDVTDSR